MYKQLAAISFQLMAYIKDFDLLKFISKGHHPKQYWQSSCPKAIPIYPSLDKLFFFMIWRQSIFHQAELIIQYHTQIPFKFFLDSHLLHMHLSGFECFQDHRWCPSKLNWRNFAIPCICHNQYNRVRMKHNAKIWSTNLARSSQHALPTKGPFPRDACQTRTWHNKEMLSPPRPCKLSKWKSCNCTRLWMPTPNSSGGGNTGRVHQSSRKSWEVGRYPTCFQYWYNNIGQ